MKYANKMVVGYFLITWKCGNTWKSEAHSGKEKTAVLWIWTSHPLVIAPVPELLYTPAAPVYSAAWLKALLFD